MKKVFTALFSVRLTIILLIVFAVSIASATFIEDAYDTNTAQLIVYRAWWFELLILLIAVNFIGNIKPYHLLSRNRLGGFLFHTGFIVMILGAGITRYFGFEGNMHIRESGQADYFMSLEPYLQVNLISPAGKFHAEKPLYLSSYLDNDFTLKVNSPGSTPATVSYKRYIKNAVEFVNENIPGATDMLALKISYNGAAQGVYLKEGEQFNAGGVIISFADSTKPANLAIRKENGKLVIHADKPVSGMQMGGGKTDTTQQGQDLEFRQKNLFQYGDVMLALVNHHHAAELDFKSNDNEEEGISVLSVDVAVDGAHKTVHLTNLSGENDQPLKISMGDKTFELIFGPRKRMLPFSLSLRKFILDRYPGSMSPMSFASEVTVHDPGAGKQFDQRIYMNHVLDYKGYRFFQSSYDTDEKGTILSVNHDRWGTMVSYFSYILLLVGFVMTLLARQSRFHYLTNAISMVRQKRKALGVLLALTVSGISMQAQSTGNPPVSPAVADRFGALLVQTSNGRIEPVHTLAYDLMHKIGKKDRFDFEDKGPMDAMQVMLDMILDPEYWKQRKMIYVGDQVVAELVGVEGKYAAFNDFVQNGMEYKLSAQVEKSFHKSPSQQNRFDKELLKTDERVNLFYMLLQGSFFKLFPENTNSSKWVDWNDSIARQPLTGSLGLLKNELGVNELSYSGLLDLYFREILAGSRSGNYGRAEKVIGYISNIQHNCRDAQYFPSEERIQAEIAYNKSGMFKKLVLYYGLLSLFLVIVAFTDNLRRKSSTWLVRAKQAGIALLAILFLVHTYAMIMRWYLSGHAPWSNGYEALLLIAWSSVLAGFFFLRSTTIIQAATAFLACLVLMTAGHSNYDPQLTNLQPVLQSYWLVIHVAVITISYGFLALGFILGFINMFSYLLRSKHNAERIDLLISELTLINEKNLQIGLFLATLGTFLGGVWANESWGRYWGWDAKETWALVIIMVYSVVLHLRLVPKLRGTFLLNACSILSFGSVLMTFIGVNYYLSKGLHSYAADDKSVFPLWGWMLIFGVVLLITAAGLKKKYTHPAESAGHH